MDARTRAAAALGAAGCAAAVLTVVAGGRAYTGTSFPPSSWFGLVPAEGVPRGVMSLSGVLLWLGITLLSVTWLATLGLVHRGGMTPRTAWTLAAAWAAPFVLGPPVVSKDVYAYAATATMLHHGLDPYRAGPNALADVAGPDAVRALAAVDPRWRDSPSPYGPVVTLVQRVAGWVGGGDPVVAVVVLRALALVSVLGLTLLAASLAASFSTRPRRAEVIVLVALNPLVLVHALSAAHVEALMCALLLGAVVASTRGLWWLAVPLACLAGAVKAPAFLAVPVVIAAWALAAGPVPLRWPRALQASTLAVASLLVTGVLVPDGWGWLRNLSTPSGGDPTSSLSGTLAESAGAARPVVLGAGVVAAVAILIGLAVTFRRRPPADSLGWGLLAVALLAPVTYPWYLLWGLCCLLPTARGRVRIVLVGLCVLEAGFSIPATDVRYMTVVTLASIAGVAALCVLHGRTPQRRLTPA